MSNKNAKIPSAFKPLIIDKAKKKVSTREKIMIVMMMKRKSSNTAKNRLTGPAIS